MIAINNDSVIANTDWQASFTRMLPEIKQRLRSALRHLDPDAREESIAEGVVHCLLAYSRLHSQGRTQVASTSNLVFYALRQVKRGRPAVGRMNAKEVLSRYGQIASGIQIERGPVKWIAAIVDDKRASVPDQVAARIDVADWFATLSDRLKQIAADLACGFTTSETAEKYGVTAGRISQLRRALEESWEAYQSEGALV